MMPKHNDLVTHHSPSVVQSNFIPMSDTAGSHKLGFPASEAQRREIFLTSERIRLRQFRHNQTEIERRIRLNKQKRIDAARVCATFSSLDRAVSDDFQQDINIVSSYSTAKRQSDSPAPITKRVCPSLKNNDGCHPLSFEQCWGHDNLGANKNLQLLPVDYLPKVGYSPYQDLEFISLPYFAPSPVKRTGPASQCPSVPMLPVYRPFLPSSCPFPTAEVVSRLPSSSEVVPKSVIASQNFPNPCRLAANVNSIPSQITCTFGSDIVLEYAIENVENVPTFGAGESHSQLDPSVVCPSPFISEPYCIPVVANYLSRFLPMSLPARPNPHDPNQVLIEFLQSKAEETRHNEIYNLAVYKFCDSVCEICRRKFYRSQVCNTKNPGRQYLPAPLSCKSIILLCYRCRTHVLNAKETKCPSRAFWNHMDPGPQPDVIKNLSQAEIRSLSRMIPFVKIIEFDGRFGQFGFKGQVILFAQDI
ncbi:hypothetical protein QAD02_000744 [Eretmocerus hayati]|uniref:Uncharacterized protein n=1 Tax=Eretmocerus hayati TaxID=131215 RepID=A0ACC2NE97_9HYME|nr:hypothetical protein QAD02_000744 [Eretmocerus hayati]